MDENEELQQSLREMEQFKQRMIEELGQEQYDKSFAEHSEAIQRIMAQTGMSALQAAEFLTDELDKDLTMPHLQREAYKGIVVFVTFELMGDDFKNSLLS